MSRGPGAVQRRILATLAELNEPLRLYALVARLHGSPTRGQAESIYRAVRTLARRGLVRTGHASAMLHHDCYSCAYVWLPSRPTPFNEQPRLSGAEVQELVLAQLASLSGQPTRWRYCGYVPESAEQVPYEALNNAVLQEFNVDRYEEARYRTAIRRAVLKLHQAGRVRARLAFRPTRIGTVELLPAKRCDVAHNINITTHTGVAS